VAKMVCLFNHKGGVSKTTTTFNLGWMMASMGKKVIIVDFDPQCSLTGLVLGFRKIVDLQAIYISEPPNNIKDGLAPAFESKPQLIQPVECVSVPGNKNLFLLQGHIGIAEYETTLGIAQQLGGTLVTLKNLPGSIRYLLDTTAKKYSADYVLIDMSPSLGPINQNLLMSCDGFIVPLHPDFFSAMALSSLASVLPRWKQWSNMASSIDVLRDADYPFATASPKFIGSVVQKFRPRNGIPSVAFQRWIDELKLAMKDDFIPSLEKCGLIDRKMFEKRLKIEPWVPILEVQDFNSIIAYSQEHRLPVFALTQAKLRQSGEVWKQTVASMNQYSQKFKKCANSIFSMMA